ncbi:arylamine N-acetyltransferase [Pseudonocardia nematodicida]|uniref:Arylamine N-acetyltransferase n=1 Tax=Pseudonocardia nematodicida TaxID=1206997 RepID=A0ABV1KGF4_9PSEU
MDYEMGSWYLVHHPGSGFRNGLVAAFSAGDQRATLDGARLTVRPVGGPAERRDLESPAAVRAALEDVFGIDTSAVAGLEGRIAQAHFS